MKRKIVKLKFKTKAGRTVVFKGKMTLPIKAIEKLPRVQVLKAENAKLRGAFAAFDNYRMALSDLQGFYDRVTGAVRVDHGWTAADVKRLAEIRAMVKE